MIMDVQLGSLLTAVALIVIGIFATAFLDNLIKKDYRFSLHWRRSQPVFNCHGLQTGRNSLHLPAGYGRRLVRAKRSLSPSFRSGINQYCYWGQYYGRDAGNNHSSLQKEGIFKCSKGFGRVIKCHITIPAKQSTKIAPVQGGFFEPPHTLNGYSSHIVCTVFKPAP